MTRLFAFFLFFCFLTPRIHAQDTLFPKKGKPMVVLIQGGVDTIFYKNKNDPKGPVSWIMIWDLNSIHRANGSVTEFADHPKSESRLIFSGGLALSSERNQIQPGFSNFMSKTGFNFTTGYEMHKFGYEKKFSADILFSYIRKGGIAHFPYFVPLQGGPVTMYAVSGIPETISYLTAILSLKYYLSRNLFAKLGVNTSYFLSATLPMYSDDMGYIERYSDPIQQASFFKLTSGIQYGLGYVNSPKSRVGFLIEAMGMFDLTPAGRSSDYYKRYYINCFVFHTGIFARLATGN